MSQSEQSGEDFSLVKSKNAPKDPFSVQTANMVTTETKNVKQLSGDANIKINLGMKTTANKENQGNQNNQLTGVRTQPMFKLLTNLNESGTSIKKDSDLNQRQTEKPGDSCLNK